MLCVKNSHDLLVYRENEACIKFRINGVEHSVGAETKVAPNTVLADYVRDVANLKGTKVMCREGGCGACLVTAKVIDPNTGSQVVKSVNSCLTPVLSCDGWDIFTVESLGDKHEGYHVVQNRIVNFHGTQCGFCTPGMVMNMYSVLAKSKDFKMEDIENNLDGNICRCTGYRPILDAFKSLAADVSDDLQKKCADIEECTTCPLRKQGGYQDCNEENTQSQPSSSLNIVSLKMATGEEWLVAKTVESALKAAFHKSQANNNGQDSVRFVAGNTSTGIFKNDGPYQTFIDINGIPELRKTSVDDNGLSIGGGITLTEFISVLRNNYKQSGLGYAERMATHLERVANFSVRNNGTVAGNLMIKHNHPSFSSDVFVLLESIGATITLISVNTKKSITGREKVSVATGKPIPLLDFLDTDMKLKLIHSIQLPIREGYHFRSFKITPRYQNAHAYVNAGLLLKVDTSSGGAFVVQEMPRLVFGGISSSFAHASATEQSLLNKSLTDEKTLVAALQTLEGEVGTADEPMGACLQYRTHLAKSLLYKTILEIVGKEKVGQRLQSGASDLIRRLTKGKQTFDTDTTDVALYKAVPKYEATIQASGEAEYTGDIPVRIDELHGAFVQSTVACADLVEMDATVALEIPGVIRFITAKDIPGENNSMKFSYFPTVVAEPVFAADKISYHGQALGLILAKSKELAVKAAKLVSVKYANETKPVVNIDEAVEKAKREGTFPMQTGGKFSSQPIEGINAVHSVNGTLRTGSQYHFFMETHCVVCYPREDGIDVHVSTQYIDHCQNTIATVLNIPSNSVNVQVRRLGGGFGGKVFQASFTAAACAVASWVSKRPVRIILDLETNMSMMGKRLPYRIPYEVNFDDDGRIASLKIDFIADTGFSPNLSTTMVAIMHFQNIYKASGWEVDTHVVVTNTPPNTFTRGPGSIKSIAAIEWIMEHIANYLKMDSLQVRQANMLENGDALLQIFGPPIYTRHNLMPEIIEQMKSETDYEARKISIELFNKENRWKKRGMAIVPCRFPVDYFFRNFPASVAIFHMDGHVAVSHCGIEMGQGINTKVIQTVAQTLQIPMDRIKVKPPNSFNACNSCHTAASVTSEVACYSVMRACEEIKENLKPILEKLENPSWEKLIADAHAANVRLSASYSPTAKDDLKGYDVWVLNLTEVEIDVLTGEYKILRTDLFEDAGKSLSPAVDLGQVEGGYIMGQGYWTTEKIVYDENSGKLLTNGTWVKTDLTYKVPECKDVPEDFRITLLANAPNQHGILRSKATGEPSVNSAFAVVLAMRNAIAAARKDAGNNDWFELGNGNIISLSTRILPVQKNRATTVKNIISFPLLDGPVTPEDITRLCLVDSSHLTL